jgi:hypothetical protein
MNFKLWPVFGKKMRSIILFRVLTFGGIFIILLVFLSNPEGFTGISNLILALVNIAYIHLTYELLRTTQQSRNIPYIDVNFIVVRGLNKDFLDKYGDKIRLSESYLQLQNELSTTDEKTANKDIVFVIIKNIGSSHAVEVSLDLSYEKRSIGKAGKITPDCNVFGNLGENEYSLDLIEVFENASSSDHLKLLNCTVKYFDVHSRQAGELPKTLEYLKSAKLAYFDKSTLVKFIN